MAAGPAPPRRAARELVIEADELWSFVGSKAAVAWVWIALDAGTRRVVAMDVGDRSAFTAQCPWDLLPAEYRERAVFCTDLLPSYRAALPDDRHASAGKEEGLTNHVERF